MRTRISSLILVLLSSAGFVQCAPEVTEEALSAASAERCPLEFATPHERGELIVRFVSGYEPPPGWQNVLVSGPPRALRVGAFLVGIDDPQGVPVSDEILRERAQRLFDDYLGQIDYVQVNARFAEPVDVVGRGARGCRGAPPTNLRPNDPCYPQQWSLPAIQASKAWERWTDSSAIRVAVVDIGVDCSHPELEPNCDLELAYDFYDDKRGAQPAPGEHHGTRIAGIIASVGNNGVALAGVSWRATLVPLRAGKDSVTAAAGSNAIAYAAEKGVKVINASWGSKSPSCVVEEAIEFARDRDTLMVVAAGNSGEDLDVYRYYPASYALDNIVSVAASIQQGGLWNGSNFGRCSVDLAAPGYEILSTQATGGYGARSGTSYSAAVASGAATLIRSAHGGESYTETRDRMLALASGSGLETLSGGLLDLGAAITPKKAPGFQKPNQCR